MFSSCLGPPEVHQSQFAPCEVGFRRGILLLGARPTRIRFHREAAHYILQSICAAGRGTSVFSHRFTGASLADRDAMGGINRRDRPSAGGQRHARHAQISTDELRQRLDHGPRPALVERVDQPVLQRRDHSRFKPGCRRPHQRQLRRKCARPMGRNPGGSDGRVAEVGSRQNVRDRICLTRF